MSFAASAPGSDRSNFIVMTDSRMGGGTAMIAMEGVEKYFDDFHALKNINLEIPRGQVVVVLGPSGSGKSTLCRTINRLETIEEGSIYIDGEKLPEEGKQLAGLRADVGMVFQSFNLFSHLTIKDNVTLAPMKVRKMSKADASELAMRLLDRDGHALLLPARQLRRVLVGLRRDADAVDLPLFCRYSSVTPETSWRKDLPGSIMRSNPSLLTVFPI